ncbi:hypothetical protein WH96_13290 [Kiloniella spongiae]|uniref:Uncharacterized protein n=1 Tax=Kiloniella spongiae TaxID=1489064 RepID=A0A0H2MHD0_9PROT|nr:hypothetical protein [Kiloniella spongiae]KLN60157.1 hypothetical protein WH96_13290 [Kiloniella spongiae]
MKNFVRLSIMSSMDRHTAIHKLSTAINQSGGWICDHTLLSNVAATINFEIDDLTAYKKLLSKLKEGLLCPDVDLEKIVSENTAIQGQLTVTFIHDDPDLKQHVPAFG